MAQRNMMCTNEMLDMEVDPGHGHIHPDPQILLGNMIDFPNPNMHPIPPTAGNSLTPSQFPDQNGGNSFYGNQYNNHQHRYPALNLEVGCIAPPNFLYNPYMASSSSRILSGSSDQIPSSSNHGVMGVSMDEYGRNNQFNDNTRGLGKRKNVVEVHGNCYNANGAANSSSSSSNFSLNSGVQHWNGSYESGANMVDATYSAPPEHRGGFFRIEEGSHQSGRSRSSAICLQPETSLVHHQNHLLQGGYLGQPFQSFGNMSFDQFRSSAGDGLNWNYGHPAPSLPGRSISRGLPEIGNTGNLGYQDATSSRNPVAVPHTLSLPNYHQHLQPVQSMHGRNYNQHQLAAHPHGHSVNYHLRHAIVNRSRNSVDSGSRYAGPFSSNASERIYRPSRHLSQTAPDYNDVLMGVLSPEDIAILEFSGFSGIGDLIDQHRDMRLDIDSMSYEELLALQEKIGDVNTGLSEESILKFLKTRIHLPQAALSLSIQSSSSNLENGTCIICQVEFEENERIGILDCGHDYHADCIKQWLLVKNLCPICKTTALAADEGNDG